MDGKVGICGTGYWGKNLVRNFYELGALKTICDQSAEALNDLSKKFQGIHTTHSYEDLLSDPEIKGIVLATPAESHFSLAKQALLRGKHVFVEKPLSLKIRDGEELTCLAKEKGLSLFVGHILHYHTGVIRLKEMIQEGFIGRIQYIYSNRLSLGKIRREENILWSFAPHDISVILSLAGEEPTCIDSQGSFFLHPSIADTTMSQFRFSNGISAHIFVSWLNPFKEQRLVVVGSKGMIVFEDTRPMEEKLIFYPHVINWRNGVPLPEKKEGQLIDLSKDWVEPLKNECHSFLKSMDTHSHEPVLTDGEEGLRVLKVLDACQKCIESKMDMKASSRSEVSTPSYQVHETANVDEGAQVGDGTKIWHYSHVLKGAVLGKNCILGQNVSVASHAFVGDRVKIQNNVSIYGGTEIEDEVFLGPSCVLTNVINPRSQVNRHSFYEKTLIRKGATIGANATIVCGVEIGRYAFIGAGTVVTRHVPDYALVLGNPGKQVGWMTRHGHRIQFQEQGDIFTCPESGLRYQEVEPGLVRCLDLDENSPLPPEHSQGKGFYREYQKQEQATF